MSCKHIMILYHVSYLIKDSSFWQYLPFAKALGSCRKLPKEDMLQPCWKAAHTSPSQKGALPTAGLSESHALPSHHTLRRQSSAMPQLAWEGTRGLGKPTAPLDALNAFSPAPRLCSAVIRVSCWHFTDALCSSCSHKPHSKWPCLFVSIPASRARLSFQRFKLSFQATLRWLHYSSAHQRCSALLGACPSTGVKPCTVSLQDSCSKLTQASVSFNLHPKPQLLPSPLHGCWWDGAEWCRVRCPHSCHPPVSLRDPWGHWFLSSHQHIGNMKKELQKKRRGGRDPGRDEVMVNLLPLCWKGTRQGEEVCR